MSDTKTCTACDEVKSLDEFPFNPAMKDKRQSWCTSCHVGANKRRRHEKARESSHASAAEVREWVRGLGFNVNASLSGPRADVLVARFNREHPERTYLRLSERATNSPHAPSCAEQVGAGRASAGGVGSSPCADAPSTTVTT